MPKNRVSQSAAVRFGPAVKVILICAFIASAGVGYVNQKNQVLLLSTRQGKLERDLKQLQAEQRKKLLELERLLSVAQIEMRVKQMNLGLVATPPDQVVHLKDRMVDATKTESERLYAEQTIMNTAFQR